MHAAFVTSLAFEAAFSTVEMLSRSALLSTAVPKKSAKVSDNERRWAKMSVGKRKSTRRTRMSEGKRTIPKGSVLKLVAQLVRQRWKERQPAAYAIYVLTFHVTFERVFDVR
jgi:hypothetical protein